mgnify:CR=1 FL=1
MERFLEKTFELRVFLYLIVYNFHFVLNDIELTTILALIYSFLIIINKTFVLKKFYFFCFLISLFCFLIGYPQLIPHAIFGTEIGARILRFRSNYNLIKILIIIFSFLNLYIYVNDISKFTSIIGIPQLTVLSHIQALFMCILLSKDFLIKHKKLVLIYFLSSLFLPVRSLVFLLFIVVIFHRFEHFFNNFSKTFYISLFLMIIITIKFLLNSDILPDSGDSVKFRLAILNETFNISQVDYDKIKFKDKIYDSSGVNLQYIDDFSFDNTLVHVKNNSFIAFLILMFLIFYCKAEIAIVFLIMDDYTNGLQFLLIVTLLVTFFYIRSLNKNKVYEKT